MAGHEQLGAHRLQHAPNLTQRVSSSPELNAAIPKPCFACPHSTEPPQAAPRQPPAQGGRAWGARWMAGQQDVPGSPAALRHQPVTDTLQANPGWADKDPWDALGFLWSWEASIRGEAEGTAAGRLPCSFPFLPC